jgi:3-methyl-2-oxobutanoate hydroxymethyltransferase
MVHPEAAAEITEEVSVPTIGIGSGKKTDGQILVVNDLLGLTPPDERPSFVEPLVDLRSEIISAVERYVSTVKGIENENSQDERGFSG